MASEAVTAPELSIVVPVYNEADSLPEFHTRLKDVLSTLTDRHEIIFVDDGSSDRSFEVLEQLQEPGPGVTVVQLRRNFGKAAALATGFREARGQLVVTIGSDLQDQPEEIPKLLDRLKEGNDLVADVICVDGETFTEEGPPTLTPAPVAGDRFPEKPDLLPAVAGAVSV